MKEFGELAEKMDTLIALGNKTKAAPGTYGIFSYCDSNLPCGGGQGGFWWFPNQSSLFDLVPFLGWLYPLRIWGENNPEIYEQCSQVAEKLKSGETTLDAAQAELNVLLEHSLQIKWWGTFEDLLSGNSEGAVDFRRSFWENEEEEEKDDPIPDELMEEFTEWVREYV